MIRKLVDVSHALPSLPRTRGDDPDKPWHKRLLAKFAPHARG